MANPVVVSRIQNRRGTQAEFDGDIYTPGGPNSVYPKGYDGVGGYIENGGTYPNFTAVNYPNVLLAGELAFCTNSSRIFLGNEHGAYVEIPIVLGTGIFLPPLMLTLVPAVSFTYIPELDYIQTPFFTILYDLTDSLSPDWNSPGTNFSKNGELKITAISSDATLTDIGTEINLTPVPSDISFQAVYNNPNIEIWYKHNFPGNLTFSTSTISWVAYV